MDFDLRERERPQLCLDNGGCDDDLGVTRVGFGLAMMF